MDGGLCGAAREMKNKASTGFELGLWQILTIEEKNCPDQLDYPEENEINFKSNIKHFQNISLQIDQVTSFYVKRCSS